MIRANLLPRAKERIGFGGFDIDSEYVRQAFFGLVIVAVVVTIGVGIELLRLSRLEAAAGRQELRIAANAPQRAQAKSLALEVARYQNFANEARAYRRTGTDVAIELARIGNSVPDRVWVDSLERGSDGAYTVAGGSRTVDVLGGTIVSLGRAIPQTHASIVNIDARQNDGNVHFSARIADTRGGSGQTAEAASTGARQSATTSPTIGTP